MRLRTHLIVFLITWVQGWALDRLCILQKQSKRHKGMGGGPATVCLWSGRELRGSRVSQPPPVLTQRLGRFLAFFHPPDSPPQKAFILQAAWGSEAPDPYGNEQREKEQQAFYRKSCQQGSGCCSPSNDLITRKAGE